MGQSLEDIKRSTAYGTLDVMSDCDTLRCNRPADLCSARRWGEAAPIWSISLGIAACYDCNWYANAKIST